MALSRTLPPVLPPNFLSRKAILASVLVDRPGVTLISAPAGYGKSALVAEYASTVNLKVIWYTVSNSDDSQELCDYLLQAVRSVIPNFGDWYTSTNLYELREFIDKVFFELSSQNERFVLILDTEKTDNEFAHKIGPYFISQLPSNIHFFLIRRGTSEDLYGLLSKTQNFKMFSTQDLRFSANEIKAVADIHRIENSAENLMHLNLAIGWPAATQILANSISRGVISNMTSVTSILSTEQLQLQVSELLQVLTKNDRKALESLACVEEFTPAIAKVILQDLFSTSVLNALATEGLFLRFTSDPSGTYIFNPVIRAGLLFKPLLTESERQEINKRMSLAFQDQGKYKLALEFAKNSGDQSAYRSLFRSGMRELVATGGGQELLSLAGIVGDSSPNGALKRQTVELIGFVCDLQFENALSLIQEMNFSARGGDMEEFIKKFTSAAKVFVLFSLGRLEDLEEGRLAIREGSGNQLDLAIVDKISILRTIAEKEIIYDRSNELQELLAQAVVLVGNDKSPLTNYFLNAIEASALIARGDYREAFEVANHVIAQAERDGYIGICGPLDAMYVKARCLLEFARTDDALQIFEQIRNLGIKWKQYSWLYVAESFLARNLAQAGNIPAALEIVRIQRDRALALQMKNGLSGISDVTEISIRYTARDWDRVATLLERAPDFLTVQQIRTLYNFYINPKSNKYDPDKLPENTSREQIYKKIAQAQANLGHEKIALSFMAQALEIGSRFGVKENFLRQETEILNLILKLSNERPTLYLEELATLITSRTKEKVGRSYGLLAPLTKRELEILRHLATGKPISSIASTLHVSQNTMKTHLKNIYRKMQTEGRESAVAKAESLFIL